MNMLKVRNSAEFVNYVKPEVVMIEMEIESSLLVLSGEGGAPGVGAGGDDNGSTIGGGGNNTGGGLYNRKPIVRR
jgi:hypothetical protein